MPIDWFTVSAQILNFLILVWLMRRYLYQPILAAIDAREQATAKKLADAETKEASARAASDLFHEKNQAFDRELATLRDKAIGEIAAERQRLLDQARAEDHEQRARLAAAWRTQAQSFDQALITCIQSEVLAITRKTLSDLASTSLEERVDEVFIRRLGDLSGSAKNAIAAALASAPELALVRSAFTLSPEQRTAIQRAVQSAFASTAPLHFETAPELICGIEFTANGQGLAWNVVGSLANLKAGLIALRDRPGDSHPSESPQALATSGTKGLRHQ